MVIVLVSKGRIIYITALFQRGQIGSFAKFLLTLTFKKKAPQPKEGDDYEAMSSTRQTVICLPVYILPLPSVLVC